MDIWDLQKFIFVVGEERFGRGVTLITKVVGIVHKEHLRLNIILMPFAFIYRLGLCNRKNGCLPMIVFCMREIVIHFKKAFSQIHLSKINLAISFNNSDLICST